MPKIFHSFKKIFHADPTKKISEEESLFQSSSQTLLRKNDKINNLNNFSNSNLTSISSLSDQQSNNHDTPYTYSTGDDNSTEESTTKILYQNPHKISSFFAGAGKEKYTSNTISTLNCSKSLFTSINQANDYKPLTTLREKLKIEHDSLLKRNCKLKTDFDNIKEINDKLRDQLIELEKLNQKLLTDNADVLQESIKNRFLKLESDDLTRLTKQYKQKLEEKENLIVKFQRQFENLKIKNNIAYKQREEALLEASHATHKLNELSKECAELDIYKSENIQRRHYFNELQTLLGNNRVYLRVSSTLENSCLSFMADDKILIKSSINNDKAKNLICRFTKVYQPNVKINEIFEEIEPLLLTTIDGFNCCFITFGQAKTDKIQTVFGDDDNSGILTDSLRFFLKVTQENTNWTYNIYVSALIVYRNYIYDAFKQKLIDIEDDGVNFKMKCTDEYSIENDNQIKNLIFKIKTSKESFWPKPTLNKQYTHLVVIIRLVGKCKMTEEKTTGLAIFCDTCDFEDNLELLITDKEHLREEKIVNETFVDLSKILCKFKQHKQSKRSLIQPKTTLTKLLYPCFDNNSKCCLICHCLNRTEDHCNILRTIQFGLTAMPKQKTQCEINKKNVVQWNFVG